MATTGIYTGWVLVHDHVNVIVALYSNSNETSTQSIIETFETEQEMLDRIVELELIPLSEEGG